MLPVDFSDAPARRAEHTPDRYDQLFFGEQYAAGGGILARFWKEMSYGAFTVDGEVAPWRRVGRTRTSYAGGSAGMGAAPNNSQTLLEDAVRANDAIIDFGQFDNDGPDGRPNSGDDDGAVDALFLVYAGSSAAENGNLQTLWPHAWHHDVTTNDRAAGGGMIRIDRYAAVPEHMEQPGPDGDLLTVGVVAHEFGHLLGLPDLVEGDHGAGVGAWDLMGNGMWGFRHSSRPTGLSAWSRARLGWVTPQLLQGDHVGHALGSSYAARTAVKLPIAGTPLHEHYLVELEYRVDGVTVVAAPAGGATSFTDPRTPFDTSTLVDGNHSWRAASFDRAGNSVFTNPVTQFVVNNTVEAVPPSGSVVAPGPGVLASLNVPLTASVSDNNVLVRIEWLLDGTPIAGMVDILPPGYSGGVRTRTWASTGGVAPGTHTISARITDASGNIFTTPPVTVTK